MKTAVSILHELMTQKKLPAPEYEFGDMVLGRSNIPEFSCTVTADNHSAVGKGSTKKEAKQNCVKNFLETYKCAEVILPTNEGTSILPSCTGKENLIAFNYVGKLNEFSAIKRRPAPIYSERMTLTSGFLCVCKMEGIVTEGFGLNKKQAKQDAAKKMCLRIKDLKITPPSPTDIISPLTNKIPLAEVDVKAVLEKYSQLTMNTGAVHQDTNNNEDYLFSEKKYVPRIRTLPELRKELNNMGLTFKIENFQKSPCILSMTFDHDPRMVLMGTGENTQDAQKNMVTNASLLIDHGFTFQRSTNSIA